MIGVPDAYGEELMAWVKLKSGETATPGTGRRLSRQDATIKTPLPEVCR